MIQCINEKRCELCMLEIEKTRKRLQKKCASSHKGEVEFEIKHNCKMQDKLHLTLLEKKMDLTDNTEIILEVNTDKQVEQACYLVLHMFGMGTKKPKEGYSKFLAAQIHCNARELGRKFVVYKHITLRRFIIISKMEIAKELILKHKLSLDDISIYLHYSDYYHFSRQFTHETSFNPSHFYN